MNTGGKLSPGKTVRNTNHDQIKMISIEISTDSSRLSSCFAEKNAKSFYQKIIPLKVPILYTKYLTFNFQLCVFHTFCVENHLLLLIEESNLVQKFSGSAIPISSTLPYRILGAQNLSHWTAREVPILIFFINFYNKLFSLSFLDHISMLLCCIHLFNYYFLSV